MNNPQQPQFHPRDLLNAVKKHWLLLVIPTAVCGVLAIGYAVFSSDEWQATQSLVVREEALGDSQSGRFNSTDSMKTAQETIQEASRHPEVSRAALIAVGPASGRAATNWPTKADVESLRERISIAAPNGTEFGSTEIIHLSVTAHSQDRAIALTKSVGDQLEKRLQTLRAAKAESIIAELQRSIELAENTLKSSTEELQQIESKVGADLGELRVLSESGGGESNLRNTLTQIKNELRQAENESEAMHKQHKILADTARNPESIVSVPGQVLVNHPSLGRLKNGLVDAQLRRADLEGKMSSIHPAVRAAQAAENEVRRDLYDELQSTTRGLASEISITDGRIDSLTSQLNDVESRLNVLATLRANYSNLVAATRKNSEILAANREKLADANARFDAAEASSLITRVDPPHTGDGPVNLSAGKIVLIGLMGGFVVGLGIVFLTVPLGRMRGRRFTDLFPGGRQSDASRKGRRQSDGQPGSESNNRRGDDRRASDRSDNPFHEVERAASNRRESDSTRTISDAIAQSKTKSEDRPAPHRRPNLDAAQRRLDSFAAPNVEPTQHVVPTNGDNPVCHS